MDINTLSSYYLAHVVAASLFRTFMYTVKPVDVAQVKISKQAWENEQVREVAMRWAQTIRLMMGFRAVACFVVVYFTWGLSASQPEGEILLEAEHSFPQVVAQYGKLFDLVTTIKYWLCVVNFLLDCYLMNGLIGTYQKHTRYQRDPQDPTLKKSALIHQAPQYPLTVQTVLFLPGVVFMVWSLLL